MTTLQQPPVDDPPVRVRVVAEARGRGVVAAVDLLPGHVVLRIDGISRGAPSRHSVQVAVAEHVEPDRARPEAEWAWAFLNHSCAPNAALRGRVLVALRPIAAGERVTFDYETNEWHMDEPFRCGCGAQACRTWIRGFRHLDAGARERLAPLLAPHLATLADTADA